MMKKNLLSLLLCFSFFGMMNAQKEEIRLINPSFEDIPRASLQPKGWNDCGFPGETPPDVNPTPEFMVTRPAQNGGSYLGLVTRDNDTWEGVGQRLEKPLRANWCYTFSLYLCRSDIYRSPSRTTRREEDFTRPVRIRVWGGNNYCDKKELLYETTPVTTVDWMRYDMTFKPKSELNFIFLEAYYQTPVLFSYNGNILVDNCSMIVGESCDPALAAKDDKKTNTPPKKDPGNPTVKPADPTKEPDPAKPNEPVADNNERIFSENLKKENLREGQTFKVENLYFAQNQYSLTKISFYELDKLVKFLNDNRGIYIEVGGHTNGLCDDSYCNWLSEKRAQTVADYLTGKGIPVARVKFKGYGKQFPLDNSGTEKGQRRNQRVEIKILKIE